MDFHGEMIRALCQNPGAPVIPVVRDVPGLLSRPDGNNVSVDREGLLLAELQLKYQAATQALRDEFALIRSVVSDAT
jgi:flagellar basal-body rod protein FlgB